MNTSVPAMSGTLDQLRSLAAQAAGKPAAATDAASAADGDNFASVLKASLDKVSAGQNHAIGQAHAFEAGSSDASLSDVMIDMQKANIQFQTAVQVRNKLVSAYNDIMQMQV